MPTNPLDSLIDAINEVPDPPAAPSDPLDEAADLVPDRPPTQVEDLLNSDQLAEFRRKFADGTIEASVVARVLNIIRALLVAKGLITA